MNILMADLSSNVNVIVWIATLAFQTVFVSIAGTWWVSRLVASIREEISSQRRAAVGNR